MAVVTHKRGTDVGLAPAVMARVEVTVKEIIGEVEARGDSAVREYSERFDAYSPKEFRMDRAQIDAAIATLPGDVLSAISFAITQVRTFAEAQRAALRDVEVETLPGVYLGHRNVPMRSVGCYIPGGRYPMIASAVMSITTAKAAGVQRVIGCTPPKDGAPYPATIATMALAGADEVYVIGGVHAIAAMGVGTESIAPVDFLVGPGNQYVTEAKRQLFGRVGIDLLAGPTEVLVIADDTADLEMVVTDLLGQAEHGPNSKAILVTTSQALALEVGQEVERQLAVLDTADVAAIAWRDNGQVIQCDTVEEVVSVADAIACEHVQVLTQNPDYFLTHLTNYGALFLGPETNVAYGDKVIGTNHILPTDRASRYTGGLWVGKFLKTLTHQRCSPEASVIVGRHCAKICEVEGFSGHRQQAMLRLERYARGKE